MEKIQALVKAAVQDLFAVEIEPAMTIPEPEFGDYSTNVAMILAKQLGQPPRAIAEQIAGRIEGYQADIAGPGFINFKLADDILLSILSKILTDEAYGQSKLYQDRVVVAEYSDPNPFKVLHVGHLYTSVVGDAISNLIEAGGGKTHRVNFGGDVGLHAAKTLWSILRELGGEHPEKLAGIPEEKRADWLSQNYVTGTRAYDEDEAVKAEIGQLNKRLYQITADDDRTAALAQIYWQTRQWSYDAFDAFYARIGVAFEKYYPESAVAGPGLKIVLEQLGKGVYEKSDGVVVFKGEKYGLHTRVFINSEGLPTYETKDVGLIFSKWDDYHFDKSLIVTGNEQTDYMKVVLKSIEQYRPDLVEKTQHFTHGMVKLPGGVKQSSRLGNGIKAVEVLELVAEAQEVEQGNRDQASVLGAIKYAFLKNRVGPDLIFDPSGSVKLRGNSGPYLQYSLARAKSILRKLDNPEIGQFDQSELDNWERDLLKKMAEYPEVIDQATAELAPHLLCNYLYEMAQIFNRFYENSPVAGHPRQALRAGLVKAYEVILSKGLTILGLPTVEKM
jgi:arginyl-tRNA synthetase